MGGSDDGHGGYQQRDGAVGEERRSADVGHELERELQHSAGHQRQRVARLQREPGLPPLLRLHDGVPALLRSVRRLRGIRTLLFAGENTDQCVAASMQDAYTKGWDTLMLSDACGTNSPAFATKCVEFNCENGWGFVLTCQQLADGVDNKQTVPSPDAAGH